MRDALPKLTSLYAFVMVAETGAFATAAQRLNVTQPAVSKRIRELESDLGVSLIERGANAMRLTLAGRDFAAALALSFDAISAAAAALRAAPTRPLRIRTHSTWALRWLIPRLPGYSAQYPGQQVEVSTALDPAELLRDPGDVAVLISVQRPTPDAIRLQQVCVAPFATRAVAKSVKAAGFGGVTLLGSTASPQHWKLWAAAAGIAAVPAPAIFETTALAVQAAIEGMGAVIVAPVLVTDDVRKRRLVMLSRVVAETDHYYWFVLPRGTPRAAALDFRTWLLAETAKGAAA
jgi:LysR family glycine cleavage system transcriptional activator